MIGQDAIVRARLAGIRVDRIDVILSAERPDALAQQYSIDDSHGPLVADCWVLDSDAVDTLDFRFCQGAAVQVLADDMVRGSRVFDRLMAFRPARASLVTPGMVVVNADDQETTWEL